MKKSFSAALSQSENCCRCTASESESDSESARVQWRRAGEHNINRTASSLSRLSFPFSRQPPSFSLSFSLFCSLTPLTPLTSLTPVLLSTTATTNKKETKRKEKSRGCDRINKQTERKRKRKTKEMTFFNNNNNQTTNKQTRQSRSLFSLCANIVFVCNHRKVANNKQTRERKCVCSFSVFRSTKEKRKRKRKNEKQLQNEATHTTALTLSRALFHSFTLSLFFFARFTKARVQYNKQTNKEKREKMSCSDDCA